MPARSSRYSQVKIVWKTRNNSIIFLHHLCDLRDICAIKLFSLKRKTIFFMKICTENFKPGFF